jgi:hypothetical protein
MTLPASISPPSPEASALLEHAPEEDECTCEEHRRRPSPEPENLDVND